MAAEKYPKNKKVIVILGPTASGKTKLAVKLAEKLNGEIVSADSRQVYRGMDIGSGKDLAEYRRPGGLIPVHLIDEVSPRTEFNVAKYQPRAYNAFKEIISRGRLPFLVGGSGLYLEAVIKGYFFPPEKITVQKKRKLRAKLEKLTLPELLTRLKRVDPDAERVIDRKNRRRVQRALEFYYQTGRPFSEKSRCEPPYDFLIIGIKFSRPELRRRIERRLKQRMNQGLIEEVAGLHRQGVSWRRLEEFGLEYRWVSRYLRKKISRSELFTDLAGEIYHFAKRQLTWFQNRFKVNWVSDFNQAECLVRKFLNK